MPADLNALADALNSTGYQSDPVVAQGDPYEAEIQNLIARLSTPQEPDLLPEVRAPRTSENILAALADALTTVGAVKSRQPIPPPIYTANVRQRADYAAATAAENDRRRRAAAAAAGRQGAELQLRDVMRRRNQETQNDERLGAQIAATANDLGVNIYDEQGQLRPRPDVVKDINAAQAEVRKFKQDKEAALEQDRALGRQLQQENLAASKEARSQARADRQAKTAEEKPDMVAKRRRDELVRQQRQQVADLNAGITAIEPDGALIIAGKPWRLSALQDMLRGYAKANEFTPEETKSLEDLFKQTIGKKWTEAMQKHTAGKTVTTDLTK